MEFRTYYDLAKAPFYRFLQVMDGRARKVENKTLLKHKTSTHKPFGKRMARGAGEG